MNEYDRDTLGWLMTASNEELVEFYKDMNTADIMYLLKLLAQVDGKIEDIGLSELKPIEDFTEAKQVLAKFQLKK
jgi:hypothetical protein